MQKRKIEKRRLCKCGKVVYQLFESRLLELYYNFVDRHIDTKKFELIQIDSDKGSLENQLT